MTNNQLTSTHLAVKSELDGYKIHASRGQATAMAMVRLFESIDRDLEELQERRQATMNSEPVAWRRFQETPNDGGYWILYDYRPNCSGVEPLYRHAQPAPVVPENCVTAEHRRVIELLLNVCGAAFELADDSCQQDVAGEDCHVVPDDSFQKLSDALDEIENTLPTEDIDRPSVFLAWSAMPRAALKSILQAGNSPVIPDSARDALEKALAAMEFMGDTLNNLDAVCTEDVELVAPAFDAVRSVLAAAPQEVK